MYVENANRATKKVHALLGENGAGKSTLMNILTGIHSKDKGTVTFDGKQYEHMTICESEKAGIAFSEGVWQTG